jgi:hypothetical protein
MPDATPHSSIIVASSILSAGFGRPAEEVLTLPHNIILDFRLQGRGARPIRCGEFLSSVPEVHVL